MVAAPELTTVGSYAVQVVDSLGASNSLAFAVTAPPVQILSLSPGSAPVGSPALALTVTGTGFVQGSTIHFAAAPLATTFLSSTSLQGAIPAAALAAAGSFPVQVENPAGALSNTVQFYVNPPPLASFSLPIPAYDLVADPVRNLLYASAAQLGSPYAGQVIAIDTTTGKVINAVPVPNDGANKGHPVSLAISDDGQYLYVVVGNTPLVQRLSLPGMTQDLLIQTANYTTAQSGTAVPIAVAPGAPHTWAYEDGAMLAIYDDGVQRPTTPQPDGQHFYVVGMTFGNDASVLYGINDLGLGLADTLDAFSVDANGIDQTAAYPSVYPPLGTYVGAPALLQYQAVNRLVYCADGVVVDVANGSVAGMFAFPALPDYKPAFTVDANLGRAYIAQPVQSNGDFTMTNFSTGNYQTESTLTANVGTVVAPPAGVYEAPTRLVRSGPNGLAANFYYFTSNAAAVTGEYGHIVFISGTFVKP